MPLIVEATIPLSLMIRYGLEEDNSVFGDHMILTQKRISLSSVKDFAMNGPLYVSQSCNFWSERKVRFVTRPWQVDLGSLSFFLT